MSTKLKQLSLAFLGLSVFISIVNIYVDINKLTWADYFMYGGQLVLGIILFIHLIKE